MTIDPSQGASQEAPVVAAKDTSSENNLRKMARSLEEQKRQNEQMAQELAELKEASARQRRDVDSDDSEPYVDEKRLNRRLSALTEDIDKRIDRKAEEKAVKMIELEKQAAFVKNNPDFQQIMNNEAMLNKLYDTDPDLVESLLKIPDEFEKKKAVYRSVKAHGLNRPEAAKPSIQQKIDANRRSPYYQPSSSVSTPPYGFQGDFSEAGQKNAYDKMMGLKKGMRLG